VKKCEHTQLSAGECIHIFSWKFLFEILQFLLK